MQRRVAGLAFFFLLLFLISKGSAEALPCTLPNLYPEVKWKLFTTSARLGPGHAILTCKKAVVRIRSNGKFFIQGNWAEGAKGYIGHIPENSLIRIPRQHSVVSRLDVKLLFATGRVYYSTDVKTMKRLGVNSSPGLSESEMIHTLGRVNQAKEQLKTIEHEVEWSSLKLDQELVPWDMLWIRAESGLEVEIMEGGPHYHVDEVPQDRAGTFAPTVMKKRQRRLEGFAEKVLALYAHGLPDSRASLDELDGTEGSPMRISASTAAVRG